MPFYVYILIACILYMVVGWITMGVWDHYEYELSRKFTGGEKFVLFLTWPVMWIRYSVGIVKWGGVVMRSFKKLFLGVKDNSDGSTV